MLFLPTNQQRQSTEGKTLLTLSDINLLKATKAAATDMLKTS